MRIYTDKTVDEEFKDLGDLGFTGTLNDRQFSYLRNVGYTGSLAEAYGSGWQQTFWATHQAAIMALPQDV